jgi:hypothetical protein
VWYTHTHTYIYIEREILLRKYIYICKSRRHTYPPPPPNSHIRARTHVADLAVHAQTRWDTTVLCATGRRLPSPGLLCTVLVFPRDFQSRIPFVHTPARL